ncbi:MAG: hypothetical protein LBS50_01815 [Prevotellaceae bacterium]|jgi:hypothetical protein|nr:hypothetical protein [Prevotellaceae bacterium]
MNYSDKKFWQLQNAYQLNCTDIALYFYLQEVRNVCGWADRINRNSAKICVDLNICSNTLKNSRNRLKQAGLLDFESKNGSPNTRYIFPTSSNFDEVDGEVDGKVDGKVDSEVVGHLNKEQEQEQKQKKNIKKNIFDFGKVLIENYGCEKLHVADWLKVRKLKKAVNSETALKNFISECEKNNFPVKEAVEICAQRSWQGFKFEWVKEDILSPLKNTRELANAEYQQNSQRLTNRLLKILLQKTIDKISAEQTTAEIFNRVFLRIVTDWRIEN